MSHFLNEWVSLMRVWLFIHKNSPHTWTRCTSLRDDAEQCWIKLDVLNWEKMGWENALKDISKIFDSASRLHGYFSMFLNHVHFSFSLLMSSFSCCLRLVTYRWSIFSEDEIQGHHWRAGSCPEWHDLLIDAIVRISLVTGARYDQENRP